MNIFLLRMSAAVIAVALCSLTISAQSGAYAITNAEIMTVSGSVISGGTVVIRDGLIESVGVSVTVPADAEVLDGTGLTVYPGFFDTNTGLGIPARQPAARGAAPAPASNSNYPPSLRSESNVVELLKAEEDQFVAQRNAGFTTVVTGSSDGVFNGTSAVLNLAGESVSAMIVKTPFAQNIAFNTERGGIYPSSLMGTFSAMRQMFNDAKRLDEIKKMYAANPKGIKRPEADASLEALIPVVKGEIPVVIFADTEREILRALDLTREYGLKTIIAGGRESGHVAARLKSQNVPVLLSLNFPVRTLSENKEAAPESIRTLRMRVEVPKNAAVLKGAGVKFAFQSDGMKNISDFLKNAKVATENGLSTADAVRAMTLSAAEILGVDSQLGSVEAGKIANLVVSKGSVLEEDSNITHVFIDGKKFEIEKKKEKPKTANGDAKTINAGGVWSITVEPPGMSVPATLDITQTGDTITGTMTSSMFGAATIRNGEVTANGFTFDTTINFQGTDLELSVTATINGDSVEGTMETVQGPAPFSGSRVPKN